MKGLPLLGERRKRHKERTICTEFIRFIKHFRPKRQTHIGDHPIIEIDHYLLIPVRAKIFTAKVFTGARIYQFIHHAILIVQVVQIETFN